MNVLKNRNLKASSKKWLQRQMDDPYVEKAKREGYRSRAAYKILEIQRKFELFDKNSVVLDLGAAPGGWSQVAAKVARRVIALDLLDMAPIPNVEFIRGDFTNEDDVATLNQLLRGENADVILSDMAPNTCGVRQVDHLRIIGLAEAVYDFSRTALKPEGAMVLKIFQGGASGELLTDMKQHFKEVRHFKPQASRKESPELYLIAKGYHL